MKEKKWTEIDFEIESLGSLCTLSHLHSICTPENEFCSSRPWSGCSSALCSSTPFAGCETQPWSLWLTGCGAEISHCGVTNVRQRALAVKLHAKATVLKGVLFSSSTLFPDGYVTKQKQKHHREKCSSESNPVRDQKHPGEESSGKKLVLRKINDKLKSIYSFPCLDP